MNRKQRREIERKVKHLQKTKPWELQMLIREEYDRFLVDSRTYKGVLAPGDKVMIDVKAMMDDPDWSHLKQEYKYFVTAHANEVFTLSNEMKQTGAYNLVSFNEDETDPKWLFFSGHVKKVKSDEDRQ